MAAGTGDPPSPDINLPSQLLAKLNTVWVRVRYMEISLRLNVGKTRKEDSHGHGVMRDDHTLRQNMDYYSKNEVYISVLITCETRYMLQSYRYMVQR
jgi:hypothetical protein